MSKETAYIGTEAIDMPTDEDQKEYVEVGNALKAISLAREALYDLEYLYIPKTGDLGYAKAIEILNVKVNYAKEATALLPDALKTLKKYINK
jgi:hypothetical protein